MGLDKPPEGLDHLIYEMDSWAFEVPNWMVPEYTPLFTLAFEVPNWMWEYTPLFTGVWAPL